MLGENLQLVHINWLLFLFPFLLPSLGHEYVYSYSISTGESPPKCNYWYFMSDPRPHRTQRYDHCSFIPGGPPTSPMYLVGPPPKNKCTCSVTTSCGIHLPLMCKYCQYVLVPPPCPSSASNCYNTATTPGGVGSPFPRALMPFRRGRQLSATSRRTSVLVRLFILSRAQGRLLREPSMPIGTMAFT